MVFVATAGPFPKSPPYPLVYTTIHMFNVKKPFQLFCCDTSVDCSELYFVIIQKIDIHLHNRNLWKCMWNQTLKLKQKIHQSKDDLFTGSIQQRGSIGSCTWWRNQMETFSALLTICAGNSPVNGEFPAQRPLTPRFDVYFDLRLNKRSSKQSRGW